MIDRRHFGLGVAALGLAAPQVVRAQSAIRLKLAHAAAEVHPGHIAATTFKEEIEKRSNGRIRIQIFGNRQLGDDKQNLEATIAGTVEMCGSSGILFPLVTGRPALLAPQLPFLLRDYDHFAKVALSQAGQALLDDLAPAGLVGLQLTDIGQRHFVSAGRPVKKVVDFAGLKTRIVPVPLHKAIWEAVGTSPVGLPYGEVYSALQTKVIDAVEINVSSMLGENLWEVGKSMTLTGHYPWHNVIAVNKAAFDRLAPDLQQAMREAGRASTISTFNYAKNQDLTAREDLKKKGVQFFELEDLADMKTRMAPLVEQFAKQSPLIDAFVKAAQA
jgi:tripartite ATP-independent transporter DctP family solute receptor